MTDILDPAADIAALKTDLAAVMTRLDALEAAPGGVVHAIEAKAAQARDLVLGEAVKIEGIASTEFKTLWAHKAFVLFDVALFVGAFVAGHYI